MKMHIGKNGETELIMCQEFEQENAGVLVQNKMEKEL